jgi:hypothetical protein
MHRQDHGNPGQASKTTISMMVKTVTMGLDEVSGARPRGLESLQAAAGHRIAPRAGAKAGEQTGGRRDIFADKSAIYVDW